MQLTVSEVANLLGQSEETIYRWIQTEQLPAVRFNDRYRFNRARLIEWANERHHPIRNEGIIEMPSLADALLQGNVYAVTPGEDRTDILRRAIDLLPLPEDLDRDMLFEMLMAREAQGTTAFGRGIAIPHVRSPFILQEMPPLLAIFYLQKPLDFQALDGLPVHTVCLLITPTNREHLHLLSRLAAALQDEAFVKLLVARGDRESLLNRLEEIEPSDRIGRTEETI